jgi:periplasmic divalent cation tolerance protein
MTEQLIVFITVSSQDEGERIAEALVNEQLAACVSIVGPIRSIYRWEGELCRENEWLLLIKTSRQRYADLERRALALHSYQTPEVIAVSIEEGAAAYLEWVTEQTS